MKRKIEVKREKVKTFSFTISSVSGTYSAEKNYKNLSTCLSAANSFLSDGGWIVGDIYESEIEQIMELA